MNERSRTPARRCRASSVALIAACAASWSSPRLAFADAQTGFAVNRFEPAEPNAGWFVLDALDLRGEARPAFGLVLDYAYKPLVAYDLSQNVRSAIVRHQLFAHLGGSVVLRDRFRLAIDLPLALYQDGEAAVVSGQTLKPADGPAIGDLRLAADARLLGRYGEPLTIALGVRAWLPTGVRSQFTSDGSLRVAPQLLASGDMGALTWAARAAFVIRPRDDSYGGSDLGSELSGAIGVGLHSGRLRVGPEVAASTVVTSKAAFFGAYGTPVEALLGAQVDVASGLRAGAAVSTGLTHGLGSPVIRGLALLEWAPAAPVVVADRDHDGVPDAVDACPDTPGVPSGDPEDNGCPAPFAAPKEDTDGDGIWDADDACPALPGVRTSDERTNGCPPETAPQPVAVVTDTAIEIAEAVQFAKDSAELLTESDAVLWAVKRSLDKHPEIKRLRVEGHTDDTGDPSYNEDLSRRRAASVARWLTEHGVSAARLSSEGFGSKKPIDTNETDEGRARNRRVVFTIVER